MTKNTQKENDNHWYTDDEINFLLQYYFAANSKVEILTALLGTDWRGEEGKYNTLQSNLQSFHQQRLLTATASVKNKVIVPINLNNNHWALLYILYNETSQDPATVYYFDPFGKAIDANVNQAVSSAFPTAEIVNIEARVQDDGHNCGPWIIEAARAFVRKGAEPSGNIDSARKEHQAILAQANNSNKVTKPGLSIQTNLAKRLLPTLSQEEISPRIKALADKVFEDANITAESLNSLKAWVKESDRLLRNQYSSLQGLDKIGQSLTGLNKDLISEQYLADNKVDEAQDADYLLARALQNAEISDFLSNISKSSRPLKPYLPANSTSCAVEATEQSLFKTEGFNTPLGIV